MGRVATAAAVLLLALLLGAGSAVAAFPGRPGPIAYAKTLIRELGGGETFEDGGIYARRAVRGRRPRQLTVNPTDSVPSYSANGRRIVFLSASGNPGFGAYQGVFEVNRAGKRRREVRGAGGNPSFFPDGNRILFTEKDENGFSHIYSARTDGAGLRQLTSGPHNDSEPAISPNGRRIAFVSDRNGAEADIFAMRADGTRIRPLIAEPGSESGPDWAPGGDTIAFASTRGRGASNVFLADVNGRWIRWLTRCLSRSGCAGFSDPAFSPRGRRIAVLRSTARSSAVVVIRSNRRLPPLIAIDSGSIDEEGSGVVIGAPTWGAG